MAWSVNDPWRIERAVNTAGRSVSDGGRLGVGVALSRTGQRPYGHMACWVTWQTCASERLGVKRAVHFPAGSVAVKSARALCGHGDAGKGAGRQVSRCTAGIKSTSMMRQRKKRLKTRVRCSDETNMHKGIGADHLATMVSRSCGVELARLPGTKCASVSRCWLF